MQYRKIRHACFNLNYHLVVATKYRHPVINEQIKKRLEEVAHNLFTKWNCEILEINGVDDHIHILFSAPPNINLSNSINSFKTVTSRYIRKEFPEHLSEYYWKPFFWSNSYLILTSGGATIDTIKKYIQDQDR